MVTMQRVIKYILLYLLIVGSLVQAGFHPVQETGDDNSPRGFGYSLDTATYIDENGLGFWEEHTAIGSPFEEGGNGAVYIYTRKANENAEWKLFQKIEMPLLATGSGTWKFKEFGWDVALPQNLAKSKLIIGAPNTIYERMVNGTLLTNEFDAVMVYQYNKNTGKFELETFFPEEDNSGAGRDVDAAADNWATGNESYMAVSGLPGKDEVKIYTEDNSGDWTTTTLSGKKGSRFGQSVSMRWMTMPHEPLLIGAPDENITWKMVTYQERGAAYVYYLKGDADTGYSWDGPDQLIQPIPEPQVGQTINQHTHFGTKVDIGFGSKKRIAVSATSQSVSDASNVEHLYEAYAYEYDDGLKEWSQIGNAIKGPDIDTLTYPSFIGYGSIAIQNDTIAIGFYAYYHLVVYGAISSSRYRGGSWSEIPPLLYNLNAGKSIDFLGENILTGGRATKRVLTLKQYPEFMPAIYYLLQ